MSFSNNVITLNALNLIQEHYSNHPRRAALVDPSYIENIQVKNLIDLKEWKNFNDTVNLIFGDSHAEFLGRLYKEVTEDSSFNGTINKTLCFWTGATTLVGSLQSTSYFNNILRSVVLILDSHKKKTSFKKLNVIISLGEIDIRTKLFIESFINKVTIKEVIAVHCTKDLVNKLQRFRDALDNLYHPVEVNVFFKTPPPPSNILPVRNPKSHEELKTILEKEAYPAFLPLEDRQENYIFFLKAIKSACLMAGVNFLIGPNDNASQLDSDMSFDGVHVSTGDWAINNSNQIFLGL